MNYPTSTKWAYRIQGPKSGKNNPHELTRIPVTPCIKPLKAKFIGVIFPLFITGRGPFCRKKLLFPSRNKISKKTIFQNLWNKPAFLKHQQHRPQIEISIFQPLMFKKCYFHGWYQLLGIFNLLMLTTNQPPSPPVQTSKSCPKGVTLESDQQGFDLKSPGEGILMVL